MHLLDPFYRADQSRSRATGGSGSGLYLVRCILELHDAACAFKNTHLVKRILELCGVSGAKNSTLAGVLFEVKLEA